MKFRRIFSVFTALAVSCSLFAGIAANAEDISAEKANIMAAAGLAAPAGQVQGEDSAKVKKDEAAVIARNILEDPASCEITGTSFNIPSGAQWHPTWNIEFMRKLMPGGNSNVTIDAETGAIVGYNTWTNTYVQQNYIAEFTRSEALAIAEHFLKDKAGVGLDGYEVQQEDPYAYGGRMNGVKGPVTYNFNYVKKVNGALLSNDNINITVDGTNGKVTSFYKNNPGIDLSLLPATDGILSPEQIMGKYRDSVQLPLQYISIYPSYSFGPSYPKTILAYVPSVYTDMLDAANGKAVSYDGTETDLTDKDLQQAVLTPVPMSPGTLPASSKITDDEAKSMAEGYKKAVEEMMNVKFDGTGSQPYMSSSRQGDYWSCSWNKSDGALNYNFYISINKETGHVANLSMGKYDYEKEKMMKVAPDLAKQPENAQMVNWSRERRPHSMPLKNSYPICMASLPTKMSRSLF